MKVNSIEGQSAHDLPDNSTIISLFRDQLSRSPDAIAVNAFGERLTFAELNKRANRLASYLVKYGVRADVPVGICIERSVAMLVGVLAVLKAGGAYVPIDPAYPEKRFHYILADSSTSLVLTQQKHASICSAGDKRVHCLDTEWPAMDEESEDDTPVVIHPNNLAYILYTSGSTGQPKGVAMPHASLVNLLQWQMNDWTCSGPCRVLQFASLNFDVSFQEIFSTWCTGGTVVLIEESQRKDPAALCRFLINHHIERLFLPYVALKHLAEFCVRDQLYPTLLRDVITAGEQLQITPDISQFFSQLPKTRLQNQYGPTETHVVTSFRLPLRPSEWQSLPPIGKAISNTQVLLLNEHRQPVQRGEIGEIYIGGICLARGYYNKEALTHERFVVNPSPESTSCPHLYKTGDLGRFLPDGNLEFLGRSDHQLKIRGYRVELGEIEVILRQHPMVAEAVAMARETSGVKQLIAYIVPQAGSAPSQQSILAFLEEWLPKYSIPSAIAFVPSLPLTPNGKVDRSALLNVTTESPTTGKSPVPARNPTEHALIEVWRDVLKNSCVGVHDNFFELGGDSILAIQVCARAQERGFKCSMEQLYAQPTIAQLAAVSTAGAAPSTGPEQPFQLLSPRDRNGLPIEELENAYPMTRLQSGMVFHSSHNNGGSLLYQEVFTYRLLTPFDQDSLHTAIRTLIARHPMLRTSFDPGTFSEAIQLVHKTVALPLLVEDLRGRTAPEQTLTIEAAIHSERQSPYQWNRPSLIRFRVHLLDANAFHLIVSFHHAILDGWSLATLMGELFDEYVALRKGASRARPALRFAFCDYVALEQATLASTECREFWRKHLDGAEFSSVSLLETSASAPTALTCQSFEVEVPNTITPGLLKLARERSIPLKTVLHAAHHRLISFLSGQSAVTSGLLLDCRPEAVDAEKALGLFVNTVPVYVKIADGTWMNLIEQVSQVEREILPFRRFPLSQIQQENGQAALFEAAFNFVHFHTYKNTPGRGENQIIEGPYFESTNFALLTTFTLSPEGTSLRMRLDFHPSRFTRERIEAIAGYYGRILEAVSERPHLEHHNFSPLSDQERELLLVQRNATATQYPAKCLHHLFEEQALRSPAAVAVICHDTSLTYEELNKQSNQFARQLKEFGVKRSSLVGICIHRSAKMIVALLGILKAGAAYVPLDPSYPRERLEFMVEDAGLSAIVTSSDLSPLFPSKKNELLFVDQPQAVPAISDKGDDVIPPDSLAYVIYTSGSTGKPKGVQIAHSSVVNVLYSVAELIGFSSRDSILGLTTISFDISVLEIFLPLITGARLIVASKETASDGLLLADLVQSSGATVVQGTPATWKMLLQAGWAGNSGLKVLCGGEPLQRELADQLSRRSEAVWNLYGPTETTIYSTGWRVLPQQAISIGRPVANTHLYIVDSNRQPVADGVVGELLIGGDGVARGYLNRPDLNQEKFIPNPFSRKQDDLVYRTGDLARYLPDGNVMLLGRVDHQVKIRGHRIELGEVENRILEHPSMKEAVVTARADATLENSLVAYVVQHAGSTTDASALRNFLSDKLPAFMLPSAFVFLQNLPLTPNGKINRRALPSPGLVAPPKVKSATPPRTPIEQVLSEIWAEVLRRDDFGVHDTFIELGGHSLSALQVVVRIKHKFGLAIPVRKVLDGSTINYLGEYLFKALLENSEDQEIKELAAEYQAVSASL